MIADSAKGPPSAERAQALQYPWSASMKPQPWLGLVTVELPRLDPSEVARAEAAREERAKGKGAGSQTELATLTAENGLSIFPMKDDGEPLKSLGSTLCI